MDMYVVEWTISVWTCTSEEGLSEVEPRYPEDNRRPTFNPVLEELQPTSGSGCGMYCG